MPAMRATRFVSGWMPCLFLALLLAIFPGPGAPALASAQSPSARGEVTFGVDNDNVVGAFAIRIPDGYHAYAHDNAGDEGLPTELQCSPQATCYYPAGSGSKARGKFYEGEVVIFAAFDQSTAGTEYTAKLEMLLCSAQQCLPTNLAFSGILPTDAPPVAHMPWFSQWQKHIQSQSAAFAPRYDAPALEIDGIWQALFWGFLAGIVLNVMPCVLPVLSLKVSALLTGNAAAGAMRAYCLYFAAGIITFFTILALGLGLGGLLWGQFFQSPALVAGLLFVVVLLALSLFGVFTLPVLDLKAASGLRHSGLQAYMTGMLATLLATPCSGPFLGGVLAWVVNQPLFIVFLVFWGVGLGMSLPYVLFAAWPNLARFLPKPGPWLEVVEKALAFFLLGTGIYLLSVLPEDLRLRLLAALLCASFACWLYGRFCGLGAEKMRRRFGFAACCVAVIACLVVGQQSTKEPDIWEHYTPDSFAALVGKEPLLLEFTADWCPNCKFLEATVLTQENLECWNKRYALRFMRVDLTAKDADGLPLLRSLGSQSIPLAAIFPVGSDAEHPTVLRDVYGKERLERALEQALDKK